MSILSCGICYWLIWRVQRCEPLSLSRTKVRETDSISFRDSQDLVETIGFLFMLGSLELGRVSFNWFFCDWFHRETDVGLLFSGLWFFWNDWVAIKSLVGSIRLWSSLSNFCELSLSSSLCVSKLSIVLSFFHFVANPRTRSPRFSLKRQSITLLDSLRLSLRPHPHSFRLYTVNHHQKEEEEEVVSWSSKRITNFTLTLRTLFKLQSWLCSRVSKLGLRILLREWLLERVSGGDWRMESLRIKYALRFLYFSLSSLSLWKKVKLMRERVGWIVFRLLVIWRRELIHKWFNYINNVKVNTMRIKICYLLP